jgi:hypothetical protein
MAMGALYKVAYDEAVRALSEQQAAIESLRGRAGLLLSAAAVTTSFLGAQALQGDKSSSFSWLALLCFVAVAATSFAILWPRSWEFAVSPRKVLNRYVDSTDTVQSTDLYRELSLHMHGSFLVNHQGLKELSLLFQVASALLTTEVVVWIIAIASDL